MNMWTWKLGTGHGYTSSAAQWWFGLQDPLDEWGVRPYHWYADPALSRDGTRLAMTDGEGNDSQLLIAATHGPAWTGNPPYPEPDYVGAQSDLAAPTLECATARGKYSNPSWSADGRILAYGSSDGVHVINVPSFDCSQMTGGLLVAGGYDPAFGRADVDTAQAPRRGRDTLGRVSLHPRAFRAGKGTRVRFRLAAPARVRLTVSGRRSSVTVKGRRGANTVRFSGRGLRPGSYRLVLTARGSAASAPFTILR